MVIACRSGEQLPGFAGVIRRGITWKLESPEELQALYTLCQQSGNPFELLRNSDLELPVIGDSDQNRSLRDWRELGDTASDDFLYALGQVHDLWSRVEEHNKIQAIVAIADGDFLLELELHQTTFGLTSGSVNPVLLFPKIAPWTLGKWVVGIALKAYTMWTAGVSVSGWSEYLVKDLRDLAERKEHQELLRLDNLQDQPKIQQAQRVIIFLHGLLSTDLGTFDLLINSIQGKLAHDGLAGQVAFVGWPHDTLKDIDANAQALQRLIQQVLGTGQSQFAFIAHSRGGLLARATAVRLFNHSSGLAGQDWINRLKCCITFGTPHEGAVLADCPEVFLGMATLFLALNSDVNCLFPILSYVVETQPQGVLDLCQPKRGNFLYTLIDREQEQVLKAGLPPDRERLLEIFAIGGKVSKNTIYRRLINQALHNQNHDLVVTTASSMPIGVKRYPDDLDCDHMSYFNKNQKTFLKVWQCLYDCLDLNPLAAEKMAAELSSIFPVQQNDIREQIGLELRDNKNHF